MIGLLGERVDKLLWNLPEKARQTMVVPLAVGFAAKDAWEGGLTEAEVHMEVRNENGI
jgi:hypothetical protein